MRIHRQNFWGSGLQQARLRSQRRARRRLLSEALRVRRFGERAGVPGLGAIVLGRVVLHAGSFAVEEAFRVKGVQHGRS